MTRPILRPGETCAAVFPAPPGGLLVDGCDDHRARPYGKVCFRSIGIACWVRAASLPAVPVAPMTLV